MENKSKVKFLDRKRLALIFAVALIIVGVVLLVFMKNFNSVATNPKPDEFYEYNSVATNPKPDEFYEYQSYVLEKTGNKDLVEQIEKECDNFGNEAGADEILRFAQNKSVSPEFLESLKQDSDFVKEGGPDLGLLETWIVKAGIEAQTLYDGILAEGREPTKEEMDRLNALMWIQCMSAPRPATK